MSCGSGVLQDSYGQLTGSLRATLLSNALVYSTVQASGRRTFASSSVYVAYKKAQLLAGSKPTQRPQQSVIMTELQALGCNP